MIRYPKVNQTLGHRLHSLNEVWVLVLKGSNLMGSVAECIWESVKLEEMLATSVVNQVTFRGNVWYGAIRPKFLP